MKSSYLDKKTKLLFWIMLGSLFGFFGIENSKILVDNKVYAASDGDEVTEIEMGELSIKKIIAAPGIFTGSLGIVSGGCELLAEQAKIQRKEIQENTPERTETASDIMPDTVNNGRMNRAISGFAEGLVNGAIDTEDINQENEDDKSDKGILGINCNSFSVINWFTIAFDPVNITNVPVIMNLVNATQILSFGIGMVLICMYGIYYTLGKHEIDPMKFIIRAFIVYMVIYYLPYLAQDVLNLNNAFIYYLSTEEFAVQREDNGQMILQMGTSGIAIAIFAGFSSMIAGLAGAAVGTGMVTPFSMFLYGMILAVIGFFVKVFVQLMVWWYMRLIMIYFLICVGPIFMVFMILPNTAGYASQWIKFFVAEVFTQGGMVLAAYFIAGILRSPIEVLGFDKAGIIGNMILVYASFVFLNKVPNLVKSLLGGMNGIGWDDAGKLANQMSSLGQSLGQLGLNKLEKDRAAKKLNEELNNNAENLKQNAEKIVGDNATEAQKKLDEKKDENFNKNVKDKLDNKDMKDQFDKLSQNKDFKDSLNDLKKKLDTIENDPNLSKEEKQKKKDEALSDFTNKLTDMAKDMDMMEGDNQAKLKGQMDTLAKKLAEQHEEDRAAQKIKDASDKDAKKKQKLDQAIDNLNDSFDEAKSKEMDEALEALLPGFKDLSEEDKEKVRKAATNAKKEQDKQKQAEDKLNEAKKSLQDEFKKNDINLENDELNEVAQAMLDKEEAEKQRDKALAEKDEAIKNNDQDALKKAEDKLKDANSKIDEANKKLEGLLGDKVKSGGVQDLMDSMKKDLKDKAQANSIKEALDKQNATLSDEEEEELNDAFKERREAKDALDDAQNRKMKAAMDNDHSGYLKAQKDEKEAQEKLDKANEKIENMLGNKLGNKETQDVMDKLNNANNRNKDDFKKALESKGLNNLTDSEVDALDDALKEKMEGQQELNTAKQELDSALKSGDKNAENNAKQKMDLAQQKIDNANKTIDGLLGNKLDTDKTQNLLNDLASGKHSLNEALSKNGINLDKNDLDAVQNSLNTINEATDDLENAKNTLAEEMKKPVSEQNQAVIDKAKNDITNAQNKINDANQKLDNILGNDGDTTKSQNLMNDLASGKHSLNEALNKNGINLDKNDLNAVHDSLNTINEATNDLENAKNTLSEEMKKPASEQNQSVINQAKKDISDAQNKLNNANQKLDGILGDKVDSQQKQELLDGLKSGGAPTASEIKEAFGKEGIALSDNQAQELSNSLKEQQAAIKSEANAQSTINAIEGKGIENATDADIAKLSQAKKELSSAQNKLNNANQKIDGILGNNLDSEQKQALLDDLKSSGVPTASEIKEAFGKEGIALSDNQAQELSNSMKEQQTAARKEANAQSTINEIEGKGIENATDADMAKLSQAKQELSAATQQRQKAENAVNSVLQDSARNSLLEGIQPTGNGTIDTKEAMNQFLQDNNVNLDTNQKEQLHNAYQSKQQAQESKKAAQSTLAAESGKDNPNQNVIDKANEEIAKADKTIQDASKTMEGIVSDGIKSQAIESLVNDVEKGSASISKDALQAELASKGINLDDTAASALFSANEKKEKAEAKRDQAQNRLREIAETGNPDNPNDIKVAQEARQEIMSANQEIMSAEQSMENILGEAVAPAAVNEALKSVEQGMAQVSKANQELQSAQINAKAAELNYNNVAQTATGNKPIASASDFIKQLENATQVASVSLGNDLVSNLAEQIVSDNLTQEEAINQLSDHLRTEQGLTGDTRRLAENMIKGFENKSNSLQDAVQRNINTGEGSAESIKQAESTINELANNASKIANGSIGDSRKESAVQNAINTLKESGTEAAFDALIDGYTTAGFEPAEAVEQAKNDMKVIEQSVKQAANGVAKDINVDNNKMGPIGQAISSHGSLGSAIAEAFISGGENGKNTVAGFHQQQHAETLAKNDLVDMKANQFAKKQTSDFLNNATTKVVDGLNLGENNSFFTAGNLGFANNVLATAQTGGIEAAKSQMVESYMKQGMSEKRATSMANANIGHVEAAMDNVKRAQDVMDSYQSGGRDEAFKTLTQSFKDAGMSATNATIKAHESMQHVESAIQSATKDTVLQTANTIGFNTVSGSEVSQQIADNFGNQSEMQKTIASFVSNPTQAAQTTQQIMDNATQKIADSFNKPETQISSDSSVNNQAISAVTNAFATGGRDGAMNEMVSQLTASGVPSEEIQQRAEAGVSFIESAIADSTNEALSGLHTSGQIYDVDKVSADMLSSFGGTNPVGLQTTLSNSIKEQIKGADSTDFNTGMVSSYAFNNAANEAKLDSRISHAQTLANIEANASSGWSKLNDSTKNIIMGAYASGKDEQDRDWVVNELAQQLGGSDADLETADSIIREMETTTGVGWNANKEINRLQLNGELNENTLNKILTTDAIRRGGINPKHNPEELRQHVKNGMKNYSNLGVSERSYREKVNEERKNSSFSLKVNGQNHRFGVEQLDTRQDGKFDETSLSAGKVKTEDNNNDPNKNKRS